MKKTWMAIAVMFITLSVSAETLLTEDFDYAQGELLTDHTWFTQWGTPAAITVTSGLEFDGFAGCGIGNAAVLDVAESQQLHKSFTEVTEGSIYVAFMFQPTIAYTEGYFFCLRDNKLDNQTYNFNARVFINAFGQLGLTFANNGKKVYNEQVIDAATTYLMVLKYTVNAGANNDAVSLYLLDTFTDTEPSEPFIGPLTDAAAKDINPANIVLRSYSSDVWLVVDGLRVGTTWQDAVKAGDCPPNTALRPTLADNHNLYVQNSQVHFEITEPNSSIALYDVTGRCLKQEVLKAGQHALTLVKGSYILQINNQTQKFIID